MKLFRLDLHLPNEIANMQEYCTDSLEADGGQLRELALIKQLVNKCKYNKAKLPYHVKRNRMLQRPLQFYI
jgi:hypothetical protein